MDLDKILDRVLAENSSLVNDWLSGKKGSWGALAGKALVAFKKEKGSLTDAEKREVWQLLWNKLIRMRV